MSNHEISIDNQVVVSQAGESLLDTLLRHDVDINHSCHQGICQSCRIRCLDTDPPPESQQGLKEGWKQQNHFLACLCFPQQNMRVAHISHQDFVTHGTVTNKQNLSRDIVSITLTVDQSFDYFAGQFVNLKREDGLTRSYSIANNNIKGPNLDFHIRQLAGGKFSEWIHQELNIGDKLEVSEPQGLCYYTSEQTEQPLLLVGTGSGLAPLVGIISEALHQRHQGEIHLYHGSRDKEGLYWVDKMQSLAEEHDNFFYTPCLSQETRPDHIASGRANDIAFSTLTDLEGWRVFLCGHPEMVKQSKQQAFINGAGFDDIYADAFVVSSAPA